MKQTVNNSAFHDAFVNYGRTDNFSYDALDLLFDYFESIESDTGEEIELDVIAVSYTHLDVYKRQPLYMSWIFFPSFL